MSLNTILATAPLATTGFHIKATGTTLGNSLIWDNGTNVGIGNTNTSYTLDVSGTGRFTGRLNVNAASGFAELYVKGASSTTGMYLFDNNTESGLWKVDSGYMAFATTNVERMRITSAGNVGIGTASPTSRCLTLYGTSDTNRGISFRGPAGSGGNIMLEGYDSDDNEYSNFEFVANSGGGYFVFNSGTGTNPNSWTTNARMVIGTNGRVGIGTSSPNASYKLTLSGASSGVVAGLALVDTEAYSYSMYTGASALIFRDITNAAERMRITSGGDVYMGSSTTDKTSRLVVYGSTTTSASFAIRAFSNGSDVLLGVRNDGLIVTGTLSLSPYNNSVSGRPLQVNSGGVIGYNTSVREAKDNIKSIEDVSWIYSLNPVSYNKKMKDNEGNYTNELYNNIEYGFIADEVEKVNKDFVFYDIKDDGTKKLAGFEYNNMIAILTKAIQEMNTKLDEQNQTIQNLQEQINILAK